MMFCKILKLYEGDIMTRYERKEEFKDMLKKKIDAIASELASGHSIEIITNAQGVKVLRKKTKVL